MGFFVINKCIERKFSILININIIKKIANMYNAHVNAWVLLAHFEWHVQHCSAAKH